MLHLEFSQKIIVPEVADTYYSRTRLMEKLASFKKKRVILITAPAGYGKTSLSVDFYHSLRKEMKMWISLSTYDNSIENFFILLSLAFQKTFPDSPFGDNLKNVISKSQNLSLTEKVNYIISSFANDLHFYLEENKKELFIFFDDFHNVDNAEEVCESLNYLLDYLPTKLHLIFISRREATKMNYPKFLAKNWLGRIKKDELAFDAKDLKSFLKLNKKLAKILSQNTIEVDKFLTATEGWITAIQLLLLSGNVSAVAKANILQTKYDIFNYFTNEIFDSFTNDEKSFLIKTSFLEYLDKENIEDVLGIENGYEKLISLFNNNIFITKEEDSYKYHELFKEFLTKQADVVFTHTETEDICRKLGNYYLQNTDWRSEYIGLNYMIEGKDFETLKSWIRINATEKLLLIHSSGLFQKIQDIENLDFKNSLEYILLNVNTFIYKEKNLEKTLDYLNNILKSRFVQTEDDNYIINKKYIKKKDLNYYVEILMLICNCNFLREGISKSNIAIAEHILKFELTVEQEIQFIVLLIKSYISTGENSKSKKYISRLKVIFEDLINKAEKGEISLDDNMFIEDIFSMMIFFDYGDFKTGQKVIRFIYNNIDISNFDITNYSQICFALFASYNEKDYEIFYSLLARKNKEKSKTIFQAYKNQYEFQTILKGFFKGEYRETINQLETVKKHTFLKNYIFFIDALILYCYNLLNLPHKTLYLLTNGGYSVSKTRGLILKLEAYLLLKDLKNANATIKELNALNISNFTLLNQARIYFFESYLHFLNNDPNKFKSTFTLFIKLCKENEYDNYIIFRTKVTKFSDVFRHAIRNHIEDGYLKNIFIKEDIHFKIDDIMQLNIKVRFLDNNKIYINDTELADSLWERPRSKLIFLYFLLQTASKKEITKEKIMDDIFADTRSSNLVAVIDVEVNKVRKVLQSFLGNLFGGFKEREVLYIKDKKYNLFSEAFKLNIQFDVEIFKKLSDSKDVHENIKAFDFYNNNFLEDYYFNWVENVRDNLQSIYFNNSNKLIKYYEKLKNEKKVSEILEKLFSLDPTDEETVLRLLKIYKEGKDKRSYKTTFKKYEKTVKEELEGKADAKVLQYYESNLF